MAEERRAPTTAKVAGMILTHKSDPDAHHAPGGGGVADVKSGSLVPAAKTWVAVTFNTAFASTPSVAGAVSKNTTWSLRNVTVNGFEVYLNTTGSNTFWWVATDAGNP